MFHAKGLPFRHERSLDNAAEGHFVPVRPVSHGTPKRLTRLSCRPAWAGLEIVQCSNNPVAFFK